MNAANTEANNRIMSFSSLTVGSHWPAEGTASIDRGGLVLPTNRAEKHRVDYLDAFVFHILREIKFWDPETLGLIQSGI